MSELGACPLHRFAVPLPVGGGRICRAIINPLPGRIRPSDSPATSGRATISMAQIGGSIGDLDEQGPEHHDPACDLHDEDGRAIAGVQTGEVEAADRAPIDDLQEPREQRPLGAVGTAAKQSGPDRIDPGRRWRHRLWVCGSTEDDVDEGEQEQPDHVHEMPVPGGRLEAEMLLRASSARPAGAAGRRSGRWCRAGRGSRGSPSP